MDDQADEIRPDFIERPLRGDRSDADAAEFGDLALKVKG